MTTPTSQSEISTVSFRSAVKTDARTIAELFRISSGGVADYIWTQLAEPGESLLDVGERRYARTDTAFSYETCDIAERAGQIAAILHGFHMPEPEPRVKPDDDPILKPYMELDIPGSYYISGIAVTAQFRSMGIGAALMERARARASNGGMDQLSLICFEKNVRAAQLYDRLGFKVVDTRDVVPHELIHYTGKALLMAAPV